MDPCRLGRQFGSGLLVKESKGRLTKKLLGERTSLERIREEGKIMVFLMLHFGHKRAGLFMVFAITCPYPALIYIFYVDYGRHRLASDELLQPS